MSKDLTIVEQKQVDFQESDITAVLVQDADGRENVYVVLRRLVEEMGLQWSAQRKRIKRNPSLDKVVISVSIMDTQQRRNMLCLPLSHLNGFLFGIEANMVRPELREQIIAYQDHCYEILFQAFNGIESMVKFYTAVGFDAGWIDKRIEKHRTSTDLNDVWLKRGVPIEHHDQLQNVINKGTFGITIGEHQALKNIPQDTSLHDNMTRVELLISALADEAAIEISQRENPAGYEENEQVAKAAGEIGGKAVKLFEEGTGAKVLSSQNHLDKKKRPLLREDRKEKED